MSPSFDHIPLFPAFLLYDDVLRNLTSDQIDALDDYMEDTIDRLEEKIQFMLRENRCRALKK